ncbi:MULTISPECIES: hypothetical protein [Olivibacter]|uniref:Oligosaccharide repeat unit polymerase n=1 Tax=Olivibacter jilunii TaxID=985016 RepID=A0ABW6BC27_9SPHI
MQVSFAVNLLVFSFLLYKSSARPEFNPFLICTYIFYLLFFFVAPLVQLSVNQGNLVNGTLFRLDNAILTNIIILLSFVTIYTVNVNVNQSRYFKEKVDYLGIASDMGSLNIKVLFVLVGVVVCISVPFLLSSIQGESQFDFKEERSSSLIVKKFLLMIPFAALLRLMSEKKAIAKSKFIILFCVLLMCVFIVKNPITEKRNAIGPMYMTILFFLFEDFFKKRKNFFITFFSVFVVLFPLSSLFTHKSGTLNEKWNGFVTTITSIDKIGDVVYAHFLEIHYDAWSVVSNCITYVEIYGYSLGKLLLGSIFFFVPRSVWATKPYGSGQTVVEGYIYRYGPDFTNISFPYPAEGYINFGLLGVIVFCIALALYFSKLQFNILKHDGRFYSAVYFSFYLFFLLRGDLMNGIAYYVGFLAACFVVDRIAYRKRSIS